MTNDNKPSGPFRAADFDDSRFKKLKSEPARQAMATVWEWAALRANARLAPLWEALEVLDMNFEDKADQIIANDAAIIRSAYRALRDREPR